MIVELISIGNELLIGQTVNTNASFLSKRLTSLGHEVRWITVVGDNADDLLAALEQATQRSEIIVTTGGLGPTHDDITKHVACQFFGSKLVMNHQLLGRLQRAFEKRGISMNKANESQALVPDNAQVLDNPVGTAPGLMFTRDQRRCIVLPGVPREMQAIWDATLNALLDDSGRVIVHKTLRTTGIPESMLFERIGDIAAIERYVQLAFLPQLGGVDLRLTATGATREEANEKLEHGLTLVRPHAEKYSYSDEEEILEEVVGRLLTAAGKTVAVAESCTGGLIADRLTDISGSSAYLECGVVAYSNEAKITLLGVSPEILEKQGAVSEETAIAMAEGVRRVSGADFGVSTTGIAGPTGGTEEKPVGLVYIGLASEEGSFSKRFVFFKDRLANKRLASQAALDLLRKAVLGES